VLFDNHLCELSDLASENGIVSHGKRGKEEGRITEGWRQGFDEENHYWASLPQLHSIEWKSNCNPQLV